MLDNNEGHFKVSCTTYRKAKLEIACLLLFPKRPLLVCTSACILLHRQDDRNARHTQREAEIVKAHHKNQDPNGPDLKGFFFWPITEADRKKVFPNRPELIKEIVEEAAQCPEAHRLQGPSKPQRASRAKQTMSLQERLGGQRSAKKRGRSASQPGSHSGSPAPPKPKKPSPDFSGS